MNTTPTPAGDAPTPRSDKEAEKTDGDYYCDGLVDADFARTLERELAAAKTEVVDWQDASNETAQRLTECFNALAAANKRVAEVEEQVLRAEAQSRLDRQDARDFHAMCDRLWKGLGITTTQDVTCDQIALSRLAEADAIAVALERTSPYWIATPIEESAKSSLAAYRSHQRKG